MFPFTSTPNELETSAIAYLRQNALTEADPIIERLPRGDIQTFLKGWLFFLLGKVGDAAKQFTALSSRTALHPCILIQQEIRTDVIEKRFLALLDAVEINEPHSPILSELRALSLLQLGFLTDAEEVMRCALHRHPHHLALQNTLATILGERGAFDEAINILEKLCDDYPDRWQPLNNLACTLNHIGLMENAIDLYRRAIMLSPEKPKLRLNHSIALLKAGRFAQGWNEHEWRLKLPGHTTLPYKKILPSLSKTQRLDGMRLLITQEEGLGDTLMYLRYLPFLASRGAQLHVWSSRELANLTQHVDGVHTVQVDGDCPPYDYHCPFISLPRVFYGLPDERMGQPVPYLHVPVHKTEYWSQKLGSALPHSLRIGLAWAGGEHNEGREARLLDRHRSMNLSELSSLFSISDVLFYSLQKGSASSQLNHEKYPIIDFMSECNDMEDTAALIQGLDLIITVDTSIVHLAGGLGKPTIMMDRFCNCWRWGYHSSTSIWYPSLRIYRQKKFDNWSSVVHDVKNFITSLLKERKGF